MNRTTRQIRSFAEHLIVHETLMDKSSEAKNPAAFHAIDKLRPQLATLMGKLGLRALLAHALVLASTEVPWLKAVHVGADGALEELEALHAQLDPVEFREGKVVLLTQLLELLVAFIGANVTRHLIGEIWPRMALDDMDFGKEGKDEKTT